MKWAWTLASLAALALAFAAGRATAPLTESDLARVESFRRGLEDPDWLTRTHRLSSFLQSLSPENLPEALEALEPHLPWLSTDELRLFMFAWARFDPAGALEYALAWPPQVRRIGAGAAVYAWGFRDPGAARAALEEVQAPELAEFLEGRLVAGWTHGPHVDSAVAYIATLPEGPRRFGHVGTLAWELSKRGTDAVMRWAEESPTVLPRYRAAVFLKAASTLAPLDPPGTARWLAGHIDADYADGALRVVTRSWAASDPPAAMAWLETLPAGTRRTGLVTNAFRVWHDRTPEAAEKWLRNATPARALDPAVRVMVGRTRQTSPRRAIPWAMAIEDAERRERVVAALERLASGAEVDASDGDVDWWEPGGGDAAGEPDAPDAP